MDFKLAARTQLALEYGCQPRDFLQAENLLTVAALHSGRRMYGTRPPFFQMATFGCGTVLTADPVLHPFLREFMNITPGPALFHQPNLWILQNELLKHGYALSESFHMFLPHHTAEPAKEFAVKWFAEEEIEPLRRDIRFRNALSIPANALRPDRLAVGAYDGSTLMGLAGCSKDAPGWMQIGIDVAEPYRGRGLAAHLVTLLKDRILMDGHIPFYGTTLSNIASQNTALAAGFAPAFVEQTALPA